MCLCCSICTQVYDLDCANVPEKRFLNTMSKEQKNAWKCQTCKCKQPKTGNVNTPVGGGAPSPNRELNASFTVPSEDEQNLSSTPKNPSLADHPCQTKGSVDDEGLSNITIRDPKRQQKAQRAEQESESLTPALVRSIMRDEIDRALKDTVQKLVEKEFAAIKNLIAGFEASLSFLGDQYEATRSAVDKNCDALKNLQLHNQKLQSEISDLTDRLNFMETQQLSNDVDITNVTEVKGENATHVVLTLANKLDVKLTEADVVSAYRVGSGRGESTGGQRESEAPRPRPIAVRLTRRDLRDKLLKEARIRRGATTADTGLPEPPRPFYVNERLTKSARQLFQKAREMKNSFKWKFAWTMQGRIYVRKSEDSNCPRHLIRTLADLERVFEDEVVGSGL